MSTLVPQQGALRGTFIVRPLSAAAAESSQQQQQPRADGKQAGPRGAEKGALTVDEAEFDAITDQIPQRPMGVVEGDLVYTADPGRRRRSGCTLTLTL